MSGRPRILLVNPRARGSLPGLNMGLAYVAGAVADLAELELLDEEAGARVGPGLCPQGPPDVLAFSVSSFNHRRAARLAGRLAARFPRAVVVFGGLRPTFFPEQVLDEAPEVDLLFLGHAEHSFRRFIQDPAPERRGTLPGVAFRGEDGAPVITEYQPVEDLDALAFPHRALFDLERLGGSGSTLFGRSLGVVGSRGCPYSCHFCTISALARAAIKPFRPRSAGNILLELQALAREHPEISHIEFHDDIFGIPRKNALRLLGLIQHSGLAGRFSFSCQTRPEVMDGELATAMAAANMVQVMLGVESGSERVRKEALNKPFSNARVERSAAEIKAAGMELCVSLMAGIPGEGPADFARTLALLRRLRPHRAYITPFQAYAEVDAVGRGPAPGPTAGTALVLTMARGAKAAAALILLARLLARPGDLLRVARAVGSKGRISGNPLLDLVGPLRESRAYRRNELTILA